MIMHLETIIANEILQRPAIIKMRSLARCHSYILDQKYIVEPAVNDEEQVDEWIKWCQNNQPEAILMTHYHMDHIGFIPEIAQKTKLPIWGPPDPPTNFNAPIDRILLNGNQVGAWQVLSAPGHSNNQIIFYDKQRSILVLGDAHRIGLGHPHELIQSIKALIEINPRLALPAHGYLFQEYSLAPYLCLGILEREE